ncbi:MAG: hypothetical protein PF447_07225 [Spirochaetaceae bacterium]|jgi:hypothetical protein|nr:hypothetical protein [Spirochaetaceae bacterium]
MKLKSMITLLVIAMVLLVSSCTTFKVSGLQINSEMPSYNNVGDFDITVKVTEFLGAPGGANLANISSDNMDTEIYDAIQREIQKMSGDAAVNVEIEYVATLGNYVANAVTFSIFAPAKAHITGTIVKFND